MAFWGSNHIFLQKKSYTQLATQTPLPWNLRTAVLGLLRARHGQTLTWVGPLPPPPHTLASSLRSSMTPEGQPPPRSHSRDTLPPAVAGSLVPGYSKGTLESHRLRDEWRRTQRWLEACPPHLSGHDAARVHTEWPGASKHHGLGVGHFRGMRKGLAMLSLSLYVKWVCSGRLRAEETGGHVTTCTSLALAPVLDMGAGGCSIGGLAALADQPMTKRPPQAHPPVLQGPRNLSSIISPFSSLTPVPACNLCV